MSNDATICLPKNLVSSRTISVYYPPNKRCQSSYGPLCTKITLSKENRPSSPTRKEKNMQSPLTEPASLNPYVHSHTDTPSSHVNPMAKRHPPPLYPDCAAFSAAAFSAAILASIFLLASRIIWSRLRCSNDCLSSRLWLHAALALAASDPELLAASSSAACFSFSCRLYLVIRSGNCGVGAAGLDCGVVTGGVLVLPGGGGGWKVTGGWM